MSNRCYQPWNHGPHQSGPRDCPGRLTRPAPGFKQAMVRWFYTSSVGLLATFAPLGLMVS